MIQQLHYFWTGLLFSNAFSHIYPHVYVRQCILYIYTYYRSNAKSRKSAIVLSELVLAKQISKMISNTFIPGCVCATRTHTHDDAVSWWVSVCHAIFIMYYKVIEVTHFGLLYSARQHQHRYTHSQTGTALWRAHHIYTSIYGCFFPQCGRFTQRDRVWRFATGVQSMHVCWRRLHFISPGIPTSVWIGLYVCVMLICGTFCVHFCCGHHNVLLDTSPLTRRLSEGGQFFTGPPSAHSFKAALCQNSVCDKYGICFWSI